MHARVFFQQNMGNSGTYLEKFGSIHDFKQNGFFSCLPPFWAHTPSSTYVIPVSQHAVKFKSDRSLFA